MSSTYDVGRHFEGFIRAQIQSGRFEDESDVVRGALKLMEAREKQADAIDASVARGLADIEAGRLHESDEVFDDLTNELRTRPDAGRA